MAIDFTYSPVTQDNLNYVIARVNLTRSLAEELRKSLEQFLAGPKKSKAEKPTPSPKRLAQA
jgi:hypothetical protein